ncbi:unnamed protein product [Urochloa humidicola]
MAGEWSAASSNQGGADGLPLITCTDCGRVQVVRRKSKQEWSLGEVFYCCPIHKRNGTGCPFWYWEEDYRSLLKSRAQIVDESRHEVVPQRRQMENSDESKKKKDGTSNEIVRLLKSMCFLCVCILGVQVLILVALVLKN